MALLVGQVIPSSLEILILIAVLVVWLAEFMNRILLGESVYLNIEPSQCEIWQSGNFAQNHSSHCQSHQQICNGIILSSLCHDRFSSAPTQPFYYSAFRCTTWYGFILPAASIIVTIYVPVAGRNNKASSRTAKPFSGSYSRVHRIPHHSRSFTTLVRSTGLDQSFPS